MKKLYAIFLLACITGLSFGQEAIITGYVDSPCPNADGRTLEIYVDGTVDFTDYQLVRQANGGGFDNSVANTVVDLAPLGSITDNFVYITNDAAVLQSEFGINNNVLVSNSITDNGNDGFQIIDGSMTIIDRFSEDGVNGTSTPWEHLDTYYYRVDGVGANGGNFNAADYRYGDLNSLDGQGLCNGAAALSAFVPFGTYSTTPNTDPTIRVSDDITGLDYSEGNGPSAEQSMSVSGINLTNGITVVAPTNFEISISPSTAYGTTVTIPQTSGTASAPVYVRLVSGLGQGAYSASVNASSTGAASKNISVSGTVSEMVATGDPQITILGGVNPLSYSEGSGPSNSDRFRVSGEFLNEGIAIASPTDFEISLLADSGFGESVLIPETGGTVPTTDVYVRLISGLAVGPRAGTLTANSNGASEQVLAIEGNVFGPPTNALVITGVFDGPNAGGTPKGIELYALSDIADLSTFGVGSANNGGGTDGQEFTFPAETVTAGTYIYVASESEQFLSFFGFPPTYVAGSPVEVNGDDAIELFENGTVIDTFGDIDTDGTGQPWEYLNGWAYRKNDTGPDGTTFVLDNWTFSGIDQLVPSGTNGGTMKPFPLASFMGTLSIGNSSSLTFKIYPNPSDLGYVNITTVSSESISVSVFDVLGKTVLTKGMSGERLDISNLRSGIYILRITQNQSTVSKKLVVR